MSWSVWAAVTKYHRLGGFNNKHLFLTVLEAGKSKIKVLADWCLLGACFMSHRCTPSHYTLTWQSEEALGSLSLLIRALITWDFLGSPVVKTSPSNAGGVVSIPGWEAKIPHASWPKKPKNRSNIVTNSIRL